MKGEQHLHRGTEVTSEDKAESLFEVFKLKEVPSSAVCLYVALS